MLTRLVHRSGVLLVTVFEWFGELALLMGRGPRQLQPPLGETGTGAPNGCRRRQIVPLVALAGAATGVVLSLQTHESMARFGAKALLPSVIVYPLMKESGPVITALIVSGRVGAGIGAELGSMRVTERIDAMEVSAVNPYKFLHLGAASPHVVSRCFRPVLGMDLHNAVRSNFAARNGLNGHRLSDFLPPHVQNRVFRPDYRTGFVLPGHANARRASGVRRLAPWFSPRCSSSWPT